MERKADSNIFKTIFKMSSQYRSSFISSAICALFCNLLSVIMPLVLAVFIDEVIYSHNTKYFSSLILAYMILFFGYVAIDFIYAYNWQTLHNNFINSDLKFNLFKKVLRAKASFLSEKGIGELITTLSSDADELLYFIQMNIIQLISYVLTLALSLYAIAKINIFIAILVVIINIVPNITTKVFGKKNEVIGSKRREIYGTLNSMLFEIFNGMRDIRVFNSKRWANKTYLGKLCNLIRADIKKSKVQFITQKTMEIINLVLNLSIYLVSVFMIFNSMLTIGYFIAINEYIKKIQVALSFIITNYINFKSRKASIKRVTDILTMEGEQDADFEKLVINKGEVTFKNVDFSYEEGKNVLDNVSFTLNPNQITSIIGMSGSGKTTITRLLLNYYKIEDGTIKIDGQDIYAVDCQSLRKNIGIVQQELMLFDTTIRNNLIMGNEEIDEKELWNVCKEVGIYNYINLLPEKLDTIVSSNSINLSGGQKQKLLIARVLLKKCKIIVFDEATSALDDNSEDEFLKILKKINKDRTIVVISHRKKPILVSDKIIVIEDGNVIAEGNHNTLINTCNYYKQIIEQV